MREDKIKNIAFWIMLILVILLGIYAAYWIRTESFECVSNPYVYSIQKLEESNNANVSCICTVQNDKGMSVILDNQGFRNLEVQMQKII